MPLDVVPRKGKLLITLSFIYRESEMLILKSKDLKSML